MLSLTIPRPSSPPQGFQLSALSPPIVLLLDYFSIFFSHFSLVYISVSSQVFIPADLNRRPPQANLYYITKERCSILKCATCNAVSNSLPITPCFSPLKSPQYVVLNPLLPEFQQWSPQPWKALLQAFDVDFVGFEGRWNLT